MTVVKIKPEVARAMLSAINLKQKESISQLLNQHCSVDLAELPVWEGETLLYPQLKKWIETELIGDSLENASVERLREKVFLRDDAPNFDDLEDPQEEIDWTILLKALGWINLVTGAVLFIQVFLPKTWILVPIIAIVLCVLSVVRYSWGNWPVDLEKFRKVWLKENKSEIGAVLVIILALLLGLPSAIYIAPAVILIIEGASTI